ncbi:uncharacterized protein BDR25DRAFT_350020 [Lindgomyces ingoldianus]|uniref:Uncharacterized protein n=1 Tax=Lindgomyces ingoldianus TaxID=673940 RepID=A0ACB6R9H8_9PLEO|nr:uncharacterized protein BDR25DRAFT_350020 [Lindgomyces ingoldianus]KAF2475742.1 hypothetical protein BDR25DRAFT_350020 [Lindgomyces ingoldianus]
MVQVPNRYAIPRLFLFYLLGDIGGLRGASGLAVSYAIPALTDAYKRDCHLQFTFRQYNKTIEYLRHHLLYPYTLNSFVDTTKQGTLISERDSFCLQPLNPTLTLIRSPESNDDLIVEACFRLYIQMKLFGHIIQHPTFALHAPRSELPIPAWWSYAVSNVSPEAVHFLADRKTSSMAFKLILHLGARLTNCPATPITPRGTICKLIFGCYTYPFASITAHSLQLWKGVLERPVFELSPTYSMGMSKSIADLGSIPPLLYGSEVPRMWDSALASCVSREVLEVLEVDFYGEPCMVDNFLLTRMPEKLECQLSTVLEKERVLEVQKVSN